MIIMRDRRGISGLIGLCQYLKQYGVNEIVEVGSYTFQSGKIFAENFTRVTCIDPFLPGYDENDGASSSNMTEVERLFDLNSSKFSNVSKIKMLSLEACELFAEKSLQAVYLDGCHRRECVETDIDIWIKKVMPGFFICGHDFTCKKHLGVREAVEGRLGLPDKIFEDSSWVKRVI